MDIPENKYLGKLCKRGHEWEGTGKSLRSSWGNCVVCRKKSNNPERTRLLWKRWRKANIEKTRKHVRKYWKANRDSCIKSIKNWQKRNPDKLREYSLRYCKKATVEMTNPYLKKLMSLQGNVPLGLIEAKREILKLHRFIRKAG